MAKEYKDLVVGLDIGTSKVMAVVAEVLPNGELKLAGLGIAASNGLTRGVIALREAVFLASFIGFWLFVNAVVLDHRKAD